MNLIILFLEIYIIGFFINLFWENLHSKLYVTCLKMDHKKREGLLIAMSLKDSFFIVLFYGISALVFRNTNILENYPQLAFFTISSLLFSFIDEKISIKLKRWEYAPNMPTILNVGATPLFEIAVTGFMTFLLVI